MRAAVCQSVMTASLLPPLSLYPWHSLSPLNGWQWKQYTIRSLGHQQAWLKSRQLTFQWVGVGSIPTHFTLRHSFPFYRPYKTLRASFYMLLLFLYQLSIFRGRFASLRRRVQVAKREGKKQKKKTERKRREFEASCKLFSLL